MSVDVQLGAVYRAHGGVKVPVRRMAYRRKARGRSILAVFGRSTLPRVSVVIPVLNESENLPYVLPRIPKWVHEVVLVDGFSTDGTPDVARLHWPEVRVISQVGSGKGAALRTGFAAAVGDIIVMLDGDGSTDPAEIPAFLGALLAGADFAKGSRFMQGGGTVDMPFYRRLGNFIFVKLVSLGFGGRFTDLCYGYNAFWRRVLPKLSLNGDGFEIETMMNVRALRARLRIHEVPSFESRRVYGTSRLRTIPDGWRVLRTIGSEWWAENVRSRTKAHSSREPAAASPEFQQAGRAPQQLPNHLNPAEVE